MLNGGGGLAIDSIVLEFWSALFAAAALVGLEWNLTGMLSQDIHTGIRHFHIRTKYSPVREFQPLAKGRTEKSKETRTYPAQAHVITCLHAMILLNDPQHQEPRVRRIRFPMS
jgi:hypothetical protein